MITKHSEDINLSNALVNKILEKKSLKKKKLKRASSSLIAFPVIKVRKEWKLGTVHIKLYYFY